MKLTPLLSIAIALTHVAFAEDITLSLSAKNAKEVTLRGQWSKEPISMKRGDDGTWSVTLSPAPVGVWEYSFNADGLNVLDPKNPAFKPQREPQKSIMHVASQPPAPWDWQDIPHGTVHQHTYESKSLGCAREVWVYTPPGYESGVGKLPLLVLQHGSGDNQQTWIAHGKAHWILDSLIARKKAQPMVVVMIDGHPLGMVPWSEPAKRAEAMAAFERELLEEALPLVESLYRVEKDPMHRAITGLSMGGWHSLTVGLGHPEKFGWVGAFSAAAPEGEVAEKLLANPAIKDSRMLWIACGKDDFLLKRNEAFVELLKGKGIKHDWVLTEGNHSWPVWRGYLSDFLPLIFQAK